MIKHEPSVGFGIKPDRTVIYDEMGNTDILDVCGVSYRERSDLVTTNRQSVLLNYVKPPFFNEGQWKNMQTDIRELT